MKIFSKDKDVSKFVRELLQIGWSFKKQRKHGVLISPSGRKLTVPTTPSDYRALANLRGDVRRLEYREQREG